ncbi:MAG TPA: Mur ligase family protein [Thermomicrobiales bacterium]|nr:Mur ligase family protein [Thermomicrobiales bacterium]
MIAAYSPLTELRDLPPSFRHWQKRCVEYGLPPVIAVAGSRGKSTVVRMLQAVFDLAGVRSAIWTDFGVEINGRRQSREIAGWNRALARLTERTLDVAVQELDWNLISAVGLPHATYPIGIITNLCSNSTQCRHTAAGRIALRALPRVIDAVHSDGFICLNGEDYDLERAVQGESAHPVVVAKSDGAPMLRQQRDAGGIHLWLKPDGSVVWGNADDRHEIVNVHHVPVCLDGAASFEQTNVMLASAAGLATGIGTEIIRQALTNFTLSVDQLPGSFSARDIGRIHTVVDRMMPSWFLKPVLRAANPHARRRQITVLSGLDRLPADDVFEVGRILGRYSGAVIHHGETDRARFEAFRRGIARNDYPPVLVSLPTERRAINRAMRAVRAEDVALFLCTDDPGPAIRAIDRMKT